MKGMSVFNNYGCCGLGMIYSFNKPDHDGYSDGSYDRYNLENINHKGGSNYVCVGFIDNDRNCAAYAIFKKRWPIVYQSEVRKNTNSANSFFFVIYDTITEGVNVSAPVEQVNEDWV